MNNYNFFSKTVDNIYNNISKYHLSIKLNDKLEIIKNSDFNDKLQLKNISFSYGENKVINDLNLEIKKIKLQ